MQLRRTWLAASLAVLAPAALAIAPPEDADCRLIRGAETIETTDDDVEVCEVRGYLHRAATPVGNLSSTDADTLPSWDETEPTTPAPAAYAQLLGSLGGVGQPDTWPSFEGTFTGNLDTMQVTMHVSNELYGRLNTTYPLIFQLTIDGVSIAYTPAAGSEKDIPMQPAGRGFYTISFGIVNLHELMTAFQLETGPDVEHTIRLSMSALYYGDGNSVYWYDAPDRASHIDFNEDVSNDFFLTTYDLLNG